MPFAQPYAPTTMFKKLLTMKTTKKCSIQNKRTPYPLLRTLRTGRQK